MSKRFLGTIMIVVLIITIFAGCGASSNKSEDSMQSMNQAGGITNTSRTSGVKFSGEADMSESVEMEQKSKDDSDSYLAPEQPSKAASAESLAGNGNTIENISNAILAERKIIRSANLTIEVENFDEASNNINSIILGIGIIQQSNINTERIYVDNKLKLLKNGTIVLRVEKDRFDSVVNNLMGIGTVYNKAINGQDVTDKFVDTESRLRLLKLEQGRLEIYLAKLEDLDKIFRTESRLTEIRHEIESLTGNLNKISSLVELSTITITMNEKRPDSDIKPKPVTYGQKLVNNLKSSLEGVLTFLGELLIIIVAAIPVIILLGMFVLLGLFIYRRIPKKSKKDASMMKKENREE